MGKALVVPINIMPELKKTLERIKIELGFTRIHDVLWNLLQESETFKKYEYSSIAPPRGDFAQDLINNIGVEDEPIRKTEDL